MELFPKLLVFLSFSAALGLITLPSETEAARAFFVFGDSLVDAGNNDFLVTQARADFYPYGIDHPSHTPSGRFSNGYNIADVISQQIGADESPLPYLNPRLNGERLLDGANFASAGVGILNDTGYQFNNIIHIWDQLAYFQVYQLRVASLIGQPQTEQLVNQALVLMNLGGNDFVNNYYLTPDSPRSRQFAMEDYVPFIISEFRKVLSRLYDLGARRVLVLGTGPIGCAPSELAPHSINGDCVQRLEHAVGLYNPQLRQMVRELNAELGQTVFIAANTYEMHFEFINKPKQYGFVTAKVACCGQGAFNGVGVCNPASNLCANRDEHVYWDGFHPCEKAVKLLVQMIMEGGENFMSPMNMSTVMKLDGYSRT